MSKHLLRALSLSVLLMLPAGRAAAAPEQVTTRAGAHDGYGRIVFNWPKPVHFGAELDGKRLTVRFDRPFKSEYHHVLEHLYDYIAGVAALPDGKSVSFALTRPFELRTEVVGEAIVIDLHARPVAPTAAASDGERRGETVGVRAGEHPTFSRLVFDLRRNVDYRVEQRDGRLTVIFPGATRFDLAGAQAHLPPGIAGLTAAAADGESRVEAAVPPGAEVRHFRSGTKVVVDVVRSAKDAAAQPPVPKTAPAAPAAAPEREADPVPAPDRPRPQAPAPAAPAPRRLVDVPAAAVAGRPGADVAGPSAESRGLIGDIRQSDGATEIDFHWTKPVAAAAFERAGYFWLVFGAPGEPALAELPRRANTIVVAEQIHNDRATVLRMRLRGGMFPRMRREGGTWTLRLSPQAGGSATAVAAVSQPEADRPRVLMAVLDADRRVDLFDPEVGDELHVVPVLPSGHGVPDQRNFVDFSILPSAQGIVVRPHVDDLEVGPLQSGVAITSAGGLALSPPLAAAGVSAQAGGALPTKAALFDVVAWQGDPAIGLTERRQALRRAVAAAPRNGRSAARWELAKFHFANGFATEALADLTLIEAEDPNAAENPVFRAVRGAVRHVAGRTEAAEDLMHTDLDRYLDVLPWRGAVHLAAGRIREANRDFTAAGAAGVAPLPEKLRSALLIDWMDAATRIPDLPSFDAALEAVQALPPSPRITSHIALMQGRLAAAEDDSETALEHYTAALDADYRPVRVEAELGRIDAELALERISEDQAVERLDRLRYAWRGDEMEIKVLRRLADLHVERGSYREALALLRQVVSNFPQSAAARELAKRMSGIFEALYLHGKADALPPVGALALYYDFQELTPVGPEGDEMIRRLADRLVGVDLLESAARLLRHQTDFRLKGADRARVATRLSVIYLLDKKPEQALEILDDSNWPDLPQGLIVERRHLRAKAFASLQRIDQALQLLDGDDSAEGRLLRAELYWQTEQWDEAARLFEGLLADSWRAEGALDESEQTQVVKLAVAYYMADDGDGLAGLSERYAPKMTEGPRADTFKVLTHKVDPAKIEFRKLAGAIAGIDELEAFMASYRDRLASAGLSAAIN